MHILISNDDGYMSPGIEALVEQLSSLADTTIVAPIRNRSGASSSLTLDRPLRLTHIKDTIYAVDGTPTDCVHLAITGMLEGHLPDMVVSGINIGQNLGDDVLYSGTVAAAIEGRFLGFPSLAFSLVTEGEAKHWDSAAHIARLIVAQLMKVPMAASNIVLNINIPDVPLDEIVGMQATRLGSRHCSEPVIKSTDPQGKPIYWVGAAGPEQDAGEGTDFYAVSHNYVSITPMHIDFTDHSSIGKITDWIQHLKI